LTRVVDFDAFRAEQKADPITLKVGGNTYQLPAAIPASLALDIIRKNGDDATAELDPATLITMGNAIFGGDETFTKILDENKITMDELPKLFEMVFAEYNGASEDPNPESPPDSTPAETATSL
jgi:flagellar motor switch protein FliM